MTTQLSINYTEPASLFEGVDKSLVNERLEEFEQHSEAIDRAFVMLCDDQGKITAAKVFFLDATGFGAHVFDWTTLLHR